MIAAFATDKVIDPCLPTLQSHLNNTKKKYNNLEMNIIFYEEIINEMFITFFRKVQLV